MEPLGLDVNSSVHGGAPPDQGRWLGFLSGHLNMDMGCDKKLSLLLLATLNRSRERTSEAEVT